jgi:tRNA(Ile)-lysidine synthase
MAPVSSSFMRALEGALGRPDAPPSGSRVLVAVSGGPDSTALLAALAGLAPAHGLHVTAGHVEHGLRGAESAGDRAAVEALAAHVGVPCEIDAAPVARGANLEARARDARGHSLARMATRTRSTVVALGHTQDDQVETVLLRLVRGAGRGGLAGMTPRRGRLWRPLLDATRADVRRYLADHRLPFRLDRSNADLTHARNRMRRLVVPLLVREFNPRFGEAVAALATRLADEDEVLDTLAAPQVARWVGPEGLAVGVVGEPRAIARRVVRIWLARELGRAASAFDVERTLALARGEHPGPIGIRGPARIVRTGDVLVRRAVEPRVASEPFRHELDGAGTIEGPAAAWRLDVSAMEPRTGTDLAGLTVRRACFDADALAWPLVVRSVEPGDRVAVPGVGTKKLQDLLVDAKVARAERGRVPVVTDATGTIVWVPGIVRGRGARVGDATTCVVLMRLG